MSGEVHVDGQFRMSVAADCGYWRVSKTKVLLPTWNHGF